MSPRLVCPLPPFCSVGGITRLGSSIVSTFFSALTGWFASAAVWLLSQLGGLLEHTTSPPITTGWFAERQQALLVIAAPIALLSLVAGVLHALIHGALGDLWRTVLLRLPVAILLGAAGAGLVALALSATDQLSSSIASGDGASLTSSFRLLAVATEALPGLPGAVGVVVAGLVILGSLALWVELIVRSAAITVATALLPLVFAASLWPPAVAWARRLAETLGALIVSKAVIVLVLSLALDAVAHGSSDGASTALTGGALLLLASFMPFALLRLVPLAETAAISHLESVRHRAGAVARQVPQRAVSLAVAGAGGAAAPGVDAVGSDPIGMMPGVEVDLVKGTVLDPEATFVRGRPPTIAVPASAGTHVWERDRYGPRLVWKPPGHVATKRD